MYLHLPYSNNSYDAGKSNSWVGPCYERSLVTDGEQDGVLRLICFRELLSILIRSWRRTPSCVCRITKTGI